MKALNHYLVYFISIIVLFSSCDIVEEPFVITYEVSDSCDAQTFVENSQIPKQKVLLEDYTGHQCGNCPRAAEMAHILKDSIYGDQLIILTVHAGWFSRTSDDYPTDYSTEVGNDWDAFFGNSAAGNPNGMINRINYPNGHIYQHTQWSQKIEEQLLSPPSIEIKIHANFNAAANLICIDTQTEILNQSNSDLSITVVLIEDFLISKQTDYNTESGYVENYKHNHVVRKSLNGPWGEILMQEDNESFIINRFSTEIDSSWNINNMSVVAFVSNTSTYEVIQVEETHISE